MHLTLQSPGHMTGQLYSPDPRVWNNLLYAWCCRKESTKFTPGALVWDRGSSSILCTNAEDPVIFTVTGDGWSTLLSWMVFIDQPGSIAPSQGQIQNLQWAPMSVRTVKGRAAKMCVISATLQSSPGLSGCYWRLLWLHSLQERRNGKNQQKSIKSSFDQGTHTNASTPVTSRSIR